MELRVEKNTTQCFYLLPPSELQPGLLCVVAQNLPRRSESPVSLACVTLFPSTSLPHLPSMPVSTRRSAAADVPEPLSLNVAPVSAVHSTLPGPPESACDIGSQLPPPLLPLLPPEALARSPLQLPPPRHPPHQPTLRPSADSSPP